MDEYKYDSWSMLGHMKHGFSANEVMVFQVNDKAKMAEEISQ